MLNILKLALFSSTVTTEHKYEVTWEEVYGASFNDLKQPVSQTSRSPRRNYLLAISAISVCLRTSLSCLPGWVVVSLTSEPVLSLRGGWLSWSCWLTDSGRLNPKWSLSETVHLPLLGRSSGTVSLMTLHRPHRCQYSERNWKHTYFGNHIRTLFSSLLWFFVAVVVLEVNCYLGHVKKCNVMNAGSNWRDGLLLHSAQSTSAQRRKITRILRSDEDQQQEGKYSVTCIFFSIDNGIPSLCGY